MGRQGCSPSFGWRARVRARRMDAALADVRGRLAAGECVYVHCWGGRGRAGTVGACALATLYGLPADEALARVQAAFDTRRDDGARPALGSGRSAAPRAHGSGAPCGALLAAQVDLLASRGAAHACAELRMPRSVCGWAWGQAGRGAQAASLGGHS